MACGGCGKRTAPKLQWRVTYPDGKTEMFTNLSKARVAATRGKGTVVRVR